MLNITRNPQLIIDLSFISKIRYRLTNTTVSVIFLFKLYNN